ncbi:O-methyltransferase [Psychroflexus maritimus]|uniref:O-methyltransferase n=1 Tax=Psychroflexus maritimus TaxID=2714865 RepID=A0A967E699_9FLAO|nr:O-methyltransferase [Psychroflexus maritimus]NGZ89541.1 O-methyltransferase [Psychroflexus maritimus]
MDFLPEEISQYVEEHSQAEPKVLKELNRETWQKVLQPRMLSGHLQGRVLSMLTKLISPKVILEIGTYTGYSAICMAEGLPEGGKIISIDRNEELEEIQQKYFSKSGYADKIQQIYGNALDEIPKLNEKFDLVFVDADKSNYANYYDLVIEKMNPGGVILSDNVLWSGKVTETPKEKDIDTTALIQYNKKINEDKRVETVLLPIRDGLTITRVK